MLSERNGAEDVGGQALLGILLLDSLLPEGWGERRGAFVDTQRSALSGKGAGWD